jgi:hypothetical protein
MTKTLSASDTLAELQRKLDFWEGNLRTNFDHYTNTGRDPKHFADRINAELGMIDSVRDIITPGWSE